MRRIALLGLLSLLPACQFAGNPTAGLGGFLADTHTWHFNANQPVAVTEDEKLVKGEPVEIDAMLPESGEIWPGPPAPLPTMQDVQKLNNLELLPPPMVPNEPPPALFPQNAPKTP
jgi:hypothetical protein